MGRALRMCREELIHAQARQEGLPPGYVRGFVSMFECNQPPPRRNTTMPKRYKRLLIALAAVASLFLVRATGLDQGLIDEVLDAAIEAVVQEDEAPVVEAPAVEGN